VETKANIRLQKDDPCNPCYGGIISNRGACWIRNLDNSCFSVESHNGTHYTMRGGTGNLIRVETDDLPEQFRPT
jgi:hypothetical protein